MFAIITGSGASYPMTSLNNSRESFVFTLQVSFSSDRKNRSCISVYAAICERKETLSTDDNMAPADFKLTGKQVATPQTITRNHYALLLSEIICKILIFCWPCISIYLFNINQLDALNFLMSLFHASTCFEHMCSSSGGQNGTIQPLVSSHWNKWVV